MNLQYFQDYTRKAINDHPNLEVEILDFYWLAINEIEEGGSERHEIDLAINSIQELIEDATEPQVGWDVAKNHPHDICGVLHHEDYWYKKEHGVYYPQLRKQ